MHGRLDEVVRQGQHKNRNASISDQLGYVPKFDYMSLVTGEKLMLHANIVAVKRVHRSDFSQSDCSGYYTVVQ